jgi:predicted outer membrane repeat protein
MKKHIAILTTAIAATLGLLLLAACANPYITPMKRENPAGEGKGLVRIGIGDGAARTALPEDVFDQFDHYEIAFSPDGGVYDNTYQPIEEYVYELSPGNWFVKVDAYAGTGVDTLAASGTATFVVELGRETGIIIKLNPIISTGTGTLLASLSYPEGATVTFFTITQLATTTGIDLVPAAIEESGNLIKTITVNAGYYMASAILQKDGITTGKSEVVHIYANLTTELAFEFTDSNFTAVLVFSSADSGPGSLREAITNIDAGGTIVLDLPAGDRVISLESTLTITKSLAILGGGATVTRGAFTGSLVNISGPANSVSVTISRVHFTGGRNNASSTSDGGAIYTGGRLTLESCIFSDNRAGRYGGAIYASNAAVTSRGSTFYGNRAENSGGALRGSSSGLALTGNLFYGNTATSDPVFYATGSSNTYSFNISDVASPPCILKNGLTISSVSFKPLGGLGENGAEGVIANIPAGYPVVDFHGKAIPGTNAAAGAIQTATAAGYFLDYAAVGAGTLSVPPGTIDEDGIVDGSVTFTATADTDGEFRGWMVNGEKDPEETATLTLTLDAHATVRALFYVNVTATGDGVSGSLRDAIAKTKGGGVILPQDGSLSLYSDLTISENVDIEGKGATINLNGHHIVIDGAAKVTVSRVHFKGGRSISVAVSSGGGAIQNAGNLTLESCIFSDNRTPVSSSNARGGAIYSTGALTILGSTFYGNSAGTGQGGAIHIHTGGTLTLQGNLFWGNTANTYKVVSRYSTGTVISLGFNISDAEKGTGTAQSGFSHGSDIYATSLPLSSVSFRPFAGGAAINAVAERLENYPVKDFYGVDISTTGAVAAGAVQTAVTFTGFVLDYAPQGPGTVAPISGTVDQDGLVAGSVTLQATASSSGNVTGTFKHWILNGIQLGDQTPPNQLAISSTETVNNAATVRAVFSGDYTVSIDNNSGPGSFREAISMAGDGDTIILQGQTITLTEPLSVVTKKLTIQGHSAILTQTGFAPSAASQLLSLGQGAEISISRVHFKGGRATNGGAIYNNGGTLTLESCIFSDNRTPVSSSTARGGAIYSTGALTILGSTFYGNSAGTGQGGAIHIHAGGTLILQGNLFWGNTANTYKVVSRYGSGTVTSLGFNISDAEKGTSTAQSGFNDANDIHATTLPLSSVSFKPFAGGVAAGVITGMPLNYPNEDFYGTTIPTPASTGAVQTLASGFMLDYKNEGPGRVETDGMPNSDSLYSGSVTFTATADTGKDFLHWIVNGVKQPDQSPANVLSFSPLDGHKTVRGVFAATWMVTNNGNEGPGSLRSALINATEGDIIRLPQGQTITLTSPLPSIIKSIVIEGNGATLTQNGFTPGDASQLLSISSTATAVRIERLRFKGGRATSYGAALRNAGGLALESCVFSDNRTSGQSASGGAIYSSGATNISGCTFLGNEAIVTAGGTGGAIYKAGGTLNLTGNLFWGNAAAAHSVAYSGSPYPASGGYNISDKPSGTGSNQSGWSFAGDTYATAIPLHSSSFKPLSSGAAWQAITTKPADYPDKDFNGTAIPANNAMAGAIQTAISSSGYVLDHGATGPGTVAVTGGTPDGDGMYTGNITLTATANESAGGVFMHWTIDGEPQPPQITPNVLSINLSSHKTVRAVFVKVLQVTGEESLRAALTNALPGEYIRFPANGTITLTAPLPEITKSLVIDGNGAILTQYGFAETETSQLLRLNSTVAEVRISRLHFKGGRATNYGAAIRSIGGKLILESCIFSDNQTSASNANGGAIHSAGTTAATTVSGCTFIGNLAIYNGGAVYQQAGSLNLTGNVFWENAAKTYNRVVYGMSVTSGGYNVSDKPSGTTESGWIFNAEDIQANDPPLYLSNFKPLSTGRAYQKIGSRPQGYPTLDFDGIAIPGNDAMAGAVQTAIVSSGYVVDYAALGPGSVTATGSSDAYGLYSGSVTFTATAIGGDSTFMHWTVNGTMWPTQTPAYVLTLNADSYKIVRGVFATTRTVTNGGNGGAGSLREVLAEASAGDRIVFQAQTVTLTEPLPEITKNLFIEGNGATLTQTGFTESASNPLLKISAEVRISRLHFKGARSNYGGAINSSGGTLVLESCIFSDNSATSGGAIYTGPATISGCTFVGNTAGMAGAIFKGSGTVTLRGNIFWKNTANSSYNIAYGSLTSGGYNISDRPDGTETTASGWRFSTGDVYTTNLPLHSSTLSPLSTGMAYRAIATTPANYPALDFDGMTIPANNAMAGAIQSAIISNGYVLDYGPTGLGTVAPTGGTADEYGLYTGDVTLTATATGSGSTFIEWIVDGTVWPAQTPLNVLTLDMNSHKIVRGVFATIWMVTNNGNGGSGSLRDALTNALEGDYIRFQGTPTITLTEPLPAITKSLVIEGNGATLTRSFAEGSDTQLLYISSATAKVRISRIHFKDGIATNNGAAIRNTGILTLESCIFSGNNTSAPFANGGAIYSSGDATISGCTFTGNAAGANGYGGAVYNYGGALRLAGNIFWGNTAGFDSVVSSGYPSAVSGGFNISDKPSGTGVTQSGWNFHANDVTLADVAFDGDFKPSSDIGLPAMPSLPEGFPATYFNGDHRGSNSTPGAMPKN